MVATMREAVKEVTRFLERNYPNEDHAFRFDLCLEEEWFALDCKGLSLSDELRAGSGAMIDKFDMRLGLIGWWSEMVSTHIAYIDVEPDPCKRRRVPYPF